MVDGKKLLQEIEKLTEDIQNNTDALAYLNMQHTRIQEDIASISGLIMEEKAYEEEKKLKSSTS